MRTRSILALTLAVAAVLLLVVAGASAEGGLTDQEELGKAPVLRQEPVPQQQPIVRHLPCP